MAKNQNIEELFEEQTQSTSVADETAKSIEVTSNGFYVKNGYVNVFVAPEDLAKFQEFCGRDNYKTFSIAKDCMLVEESDFDRFKNSKWHVYMSKPNENGESFPFGFNDKLQVLNSLPHRRHAIMAVSVK